MNNEEKHYQSQVRMIKGGSSDSGGFDWRPPAALVSWIVVAGNFLASYLILDLIMDRKLETYHLKPRTCFFGPCAEGQHTRVSKRVTVKKDPAPQPESTPIKRSDPDDLETLRRMGGEI